MEKCTTTSSHLQHWNNHSVTIKPGWEVLQENNDVYAKFYPVLYFSRYDVTDIIFWKTKWFVLFQTYTVYYYEYTF